MPVRAEGSADEDLLEDASANIEDYFRARGYRDAVVAYTREETGEKLTITFRVTRGPRYVVDTVTISGQAEIPLPELDALTGIERGRPYIQAIVDAGASAIRDAYRRRGFTRAAVQSTVTERPREREQDGDRPVEVRFRITEGPRTLVGMVSSAGAITIAEAALREPMVTVPGRPYSEGDVAADRDRIDLEYRNRGFEGVVVNPEVSFVDDGTRADVRFVISEGPQVFVDHVIIVGNRRTSTSTITREILLKPGEPLGYSARIQTQQRLVALGLFRRVVVEELRHAGEARRDVIIRVEEAPPTTLGYGGGVEGGTRLRPTGESGQAEERFEVAPRGFFEIGRRNLWGKNRAVNLFTRVSLRSRDIVLSGRRRSAGGARTWQRIWIQRVPGGRDISRASRFQHRGRCTPDWHHRPGDPVELQFREASGARRGGPPAVAAIQRGRPLFVRVHPVVRRAIHGRRETAH